VAVGETVGFGCGFLRAATADSGAASCTATAAPSATGTVRRGAKRCIFVVSTAERRAWMTRWD
jgi:hypothetical protein